ncbi:ABC-three component system protein [Mucilaginibacter sp. CAU 1740]|uniref:ABC-three component system protein n=1 Tax=Mucilaginibacter sp. CAU 1740 TaxID=3140365 RepID=UPI00325B7B7A
MAGSKITVNPHDIHSAITTWSGFVYQGKVALYHSIKVLTDDSSAGSYALQLDSLEDFAIMAASNSCLSLHQIKALKNTYYSGYEEAFTKLCAKGKIYKCDDLSFHVAVKIGDKSPADIATAHPKMQLYQYDDGQYFCALSHIDAAMAHVITEFYKKHAPEHTWKQQTAYVTATKNVLDDIVQRKVISIHQLVHAGVASDNTLAYTQTISFADLKAVFDEDLNLRTNSEAYFQALLKGDLNRYYQEFCLDCPDPVSDEVKAKMSFFINFINQLPGPELLHFCRQIMPHRKVALNSFSEYKDTTFQQEDLRYAFFKALFELKELTPTKLEELGWRLTAGGMFIPTAISRPQQEIHAVCSAIVQNIQETDFDLPYETSALVTAYMNTPSLQDIVNNTNDIDPEVDELVTPEEEKIMRWKKIGLCSIDEAKKHIS